MNTDAGFAIPARILLVAAMLAAPPALAGGTDFDGDGRSDVFWRNGATGENYLYPLDGTQVLGTEGYLRTVADQNWRVVGIGDFDGDGRADLLWRNALTGDNYLYLMNGTAIAEEGYIRTVADPYWQVAGVGDFDDDGKADILWRNLATGENYLYPMDGLAIKAGEGYLRRVSDAAWQVAGVGDLDGDGKADVLWRNTSTGENYLYPMSGLVIKPNEGYLRTVPDGSWRVAGVGDFNADGTADILWRNSSTGENYLYPMNGTQILGTEGYLRSVPSQDWQILAVGDYNGDGFADILWRNAATGENYLYFMQGTAIGAEGYTRTVAQAAWSVIGRTPPVEFEALPVGVDTLMYIVDLATTGEVTIQAQCSGNPTINCTSGGVPVNPLPRVALARTDVAVTPTANPLVFAVTAQGTVQSVSPIRIRYNTGFGIADCNLSINTSLGTSPTVQVSGQVAFSPLTTGGPVNRLAITSYALSGIQNADWTLSGGLLCDIGEVVLPTMQSYLIDSLENAFTDLALCGAPGAPLFMQCP